MFTQEYNANVEISSCCLTPMNNPFVANTPDSCIQKYHTRMQVCAGSCSNDFLFLLQAYRKTLLLLVT